MRQSSAATGDQLASALHALGVHFIMGGQRVNETLHTQPVRLIKALAQSEEARLRLSLIPLFLEHPEYALHVNVAAGQVEPVAKVTLQCYYSAAVWLCRKYQLDDRLLPDLFSKKLGIDIVKNPEENLRLLAKRHRELSGSFVNWLATYQHAEQVWRKGLEYQKRKIV